MLAPTDLLKPIKVVTSFSEHDLAYTIQTDATEAGVAVGIRQKRIHKRQVGA